MSLASHLASGRVEPDASIAAAMSTCVNCGACSDACAYDNPVGESLVQVRAWLTEHGHPLKAEVLAPQDADSPTIKRLRAGSRYDPTPVFSFVPGAGAFAESSSVVDAFFSICQRLDIDALSCGDLARLDPGYDLWWAGRVGEFVEHARAVHAATAGARDIVVMSAETLYLFREIYPRFGLRISAELVHVSEFMLPLLSGAIVQRIHDRVMYHESCHLHRHLGLTDIPRTVLRRVMVRPLIEVPKCGDLVGCCGGTGAPAHGLATTAGMAKGLIEAAVAAGAERLVSFSTECVLALEEARVALGVTGLRVDHAVTLVAEAIIGDGAAA